MGSYQSDELRAHNHNFPFVTNSSSNYYNSGFSQPVTGQYQFQYSVSDAGGSETRPKNAYVIYIIKL